MNNNYVYNGTRHVVERLIASPNEYSSDLKYTAFKTLGAYNFSAGGTNALTAFGKGLIGEIPGTKIAMSVFDIASAFVSGISKSTTIENAEIAYSISSATTVIFTYVKKYVQPDNASVLTYISSKNETSVGYLIPTFSYSGINVTPNTIHGSRYIYSTPTGYDSTANALAAYYSVSAPSSATVDSIVITGLESKSVAYFYPCSPNFPLQIQ